VGGGITPLILGTAKILLPHNLHVYVTCLASKYLPCPFLPPTPRVPANIVHIERILPVRILKFSFVFFLTWSEVEVSFMRAWEGAFCTARSIVIT
jgi:hypothetical protein